MNDEKKLHVVMLPWLAFGHMVPFLDLSIALAKNGVHVSFLSTPRNLQRLPKIPHTLSHLLHLVPLPLPHLDRSLLPESAEASVDVPVDKIQHLMAACDGLHPAVRAFVAANRPDWILVDIFHHWVANIAGEFEIPIMIYQVFSATSSLFLLLGTDQEKKGSHHHLTEAQVGGPKSIVAYKEHEAAIELNVFHGVNVTNITNGLRYVRLLAAAQGVAIRSCNEFESEGIRTYTEKSGREIIPVGILPPENQENRSAAVDQEPWASVFGWLDEQKPKTVVFVGFGSETKLKKEHIHEIAFGLEQSKMPFLWALRKPDEIELDSDVLPAGFAARTAAQGWVQMGWAPQRELLCHHAIGALFFHAGWGSIIEAMQFGHVLVFLPFIADQPLNARMMVEKGLGIEVDRAKDGSFSRDDVAEALKQAIVSHEGRELRARTERASKEVFTDYELHDKYVERFVKYLKNEGKNLIDYRVKGHGPS